MSNVIGVHDDNVLDTGVPTLEPMTEYNDVKYGMPSTLRRISELLTLLADAGEPVPIVVCAATIAFCTLFMSAAVTISTPSTLVRKASRVVGNTDAIV